jgi:hypothetical protein
MLQKFRILHGLHALRTVWKGDMVVMDWYSKCWVYLGYFPVILSFMEIM